MPYARGLMLGPAGAIWPYKFVTGVLKNLLARYGERFTLETNTPVSSIDSRTGETPFTLHTSRGIVKAHHVVHCTNAHVGHLVPGLRGNIFPIRGQMSAQSPGTKFPHQGNERSWLFIYEKGFDYLTQLPCNGQSDGEMMFGGGFAQSEGGGIEDLGVTTDDALSLSADMHLSGALSAVFGRENWGPVKGSAVKQMWTGNMGFSADGLPWVGMLSEKLTGRKRSKLVERRSGREWAAVAYSGEGMVNAWLCGKALAMMVLKHCSSKPEAQGNLAPEWFPEQMLITDERIDKSRLPAQVGDL
jgi:glycine/D-amino acid oxidase-like deaminating enzyme